MSIESQARQDARELAKAQMAYGEGAGTRRKLAKAAVEGKANKYGVDYSQELAAEMARQNWDELAKKAKRDRKIKDTSSTASKTLKHVVTGNHQNLNSTLFAVVTIATVMHQTGMDKVLVDKGRELKIKVESWNRKRKARARIINLVKNA